MSSGQKSKTVTAYNMGMRAGLEKRYKRAKMHGAREMKGWDGTKNLPCNVGDAGLIHSQGTKILHVLHVVEQLSSHAITTEPTTRESLHHSKDPT